MGLIELDRIITGPYDVFRKDVLNNTTSAAGSIGNLSNLPAVANVNYIDIPDGVEEWYKLIDGAVRVKDLFLIPSDEIKNLDLSQPIYVNDLGGFYIIEEIAEYTNSKTPVMVKMIKLINLVPPVIVIPDSITLASTAFEPSLSNGFTAGIGNTITFNNYEPVSATITATQYDDLPGNGGTATGFTFSQALTLPPYEGNNVTFLRTDTSQNGWYSIKVIDDQGLESNEKWVFLGGNTPPPEASINIFQSNTGTGATETNVIYSYNNHSATPTFATFTYEPWDFINNISLGPSVDVAFPTTPANGTVLVDFGSSGFFKVSLSTNEATSPVPSPNGGWFIN